LANVVSERFNANQALTSAVAWEKRLDFVSARGVMTPETEAPLSFPQFRS
jgi:hypothetical protein